MQLVNMLALEMTVGLYLFYLGTELIPLFHVAFGLCAKLS